mmetsp:Transcript_9961/g.33873  ORF Transcript_9961/g.33873 Transcript_9961/m.33873 type:complete len:208 (+) Transcript_9961:493-1116(+)
MRAVLSAAAALTRRSWSRDFWHTLRTSSMEISSMPRRSTGSRMPMNAAASRGSFTSLHMLPMTTAERRLYATWRSRMARTSSGTRSASVGMSTSLTKVVATRRSRPLEVSSTGLAYALIMSGMMGSMSMLPMTAAHSAKHVRAASLTCFLRSWHISMSFSTTSGSTRLNCSGCEDASAPRRTMAPRLACHLMWFMDSKSMGTTSLRA